MSYKSASPSLYGLLKGYARENRKNATLAEEVLWDQLRGSKLGITFLRQHIIGECIVDFVSREGGLIIEVDGGYHAEPRQQVEDAQREEYLEEKGYHIIRFSNEDVLYHIESVIEQIEQYFNGSEIK